MLPPAGDDLRARQGVQRGIALHTVKMAGILFKAGNAQAHPFRVRPLGKSQVDHNALRISSVLRTRPIRGKIWVMLP
ncbi:hypothetical protein D3C87_1658920 [compost metagenome]